MRYFHLAPPIAYFAFYHYRSQPVNTKPPTSRVRRKRRAKGGFDRQVIREERRALRALLPNGSGKGEETKCQCHGGRSCCCSSGLRICAYKSPLRHFQGWGRGSVFMHISSSVVSPPPARYTHRLQCSAATPLPQDSCRRLLQTRSSPCPAGPLLSHSLQCLSQRPLCTPRWASAVARLCNRSLPNTVVVVHWRKLTVKRGCAGMPRGRCGLGFADFPMRSALQIEIAKDAGHPGAHHRCMLTSLPNACGNTPADHPGRARAEETQLQGAAWWCGGRSSRPLASLCRTLERESFGLRNALVGARSLALFHVSNVEAEDCSFIYCGCGSK